jgi:tetratricopeptide (TPR) repeat protein
MLETNLANQPDRRATLQETLASTYLALGLARQAIPLQEKVREYYLKTLGLEHTNTLANMTDLARSYLAAGRDDEALKLREEVLRLRQKVNGPEHPDTFGAMLDLADSYFDAARWGEALKLREEALMLSRKVNGPDLPETLVAMGDVANSYFEAGRWDEALKLREEVLTLSRKVNGPEHPDTLVAMNELALSYSSADREDEAIKLREEVLALDRKVRGPEHNDTLSAMSNLAESYDGVGRKDEATQLQEEVLKLRQKVSGPEHPETLRAMGDLALSYADAGRTDEAIKLQEEALTLDRKVSDPEHPDTRVAMDNLALVYVAAGRKDDAVKLRQDVLALSLRQDPNSPASADAYAWLGFTLDEVRRGEDAIKAWQEAVRINPGTQDVAYWLGKALVDRQRYAQALPILRATQKFYPDGDRGRETAERLALAEAMVAGQDAQPGASDRVLAALRQTVAANPADTDKAKQLATIYLWLGQTNEHQAICRSLLDLAVNSKDPAAHDRAAKAYLIQAHPDTEILKLAVAAGRQALQLAAIDDNNRACFLVTAGMAAVRDGKPVEAESLLTEALKVVDCDPNRRTMALAYRTLARARLGRMEEARIDFAELENLRPALSVPPALSAILLEPDFLAVCLAHEEVKALLSQPPPPFKR